MKPTVSCLIPAYNEAKYIADVLATVADYSGFDQVIVIDDGSSDDTADIADDFPVTLLKHDRNQGKAAAVATGLEKATGDIICLIDADLSGLTTHNLDDLLTPHFSEACMTLSLRGNSWPLLLLMGIDPWSGERAAPREIFTHFLPQYHSAGYALETLVNQAALEAKLPIYSIQWSNVSYYPKTKKQTLLKGIQADLKMIYSVLSYFGWREAFVQQLLFVYLHLKHLEQSQRLRQLLRQLSFLTEDLSVLENQIKTYVKVSLNRDMNTEKLPGIGGNNDFSKLKHNKWIARLKQVYPFWRIDT